MDKISIIIPVYNVKDYLDECLKSVCEQTYTELEILVIDDCSNDGSAEMCDEWAQKDNRIKVFHTANNGVSEARNLGLQNATGKYIAFVDSDDYINQNLIKRLYDTLVENNSDIAICKEHAVEEAEKRSADEVVPKGSVQGLNREKIAQMLLSPFTGHLTWIWLRLQKRELFDEVRFPVELGNCEDVIYSLEVYKKAKKVSFLDERLYYYRQRKNSIVHTPSGKNIYDRAMAMLEIFHYIDSVDYEKYHSQNIRMTFKRLSALETMAYNNKIKDVQKNIYELMKNLYKNNRGNLSLTDKIFCGSYILFRFWAHK